MDGSQPYRSQEEKLQRPLTLWQKQLLALDPAYFRSGRPRHMVLYWDGRQMTIFDTVQIFSTEYVPPGPNVPPEKKGLY